MQQQQHDKSQLQRNIEIDSDIVYTPSQLRFIKQQMWPKLNEDGLDQGHDGKVSQGRSHDGANVSQGQGHDSVGTQSRQKRAAISNFEEFPTQLWDMPIKYEISLSFSGMAMAQHTIILC